MTERELQDWMRVHLEDNPSVETEDGDEMAVQSVSTFDDAGLLTRNKGLVIRLEDGSEFQVTIVQSQRARDEDGE
jgi:hypothetical protein